MYIHSGIVIHGGAARVQPDISVPEVHIEEIWDRVEQIHYYA